MSWSKNPSAIKTEFLYFAKYYIHAFRSSYFCLFVLNVDLTISISKILTFTNFRGFIMYGSVYAKSSYK